MSKHRQLRWTCDHAAVRMRLDPATSLLATRAGRQYFPEVGEIRVTSWNVKFPKGGTPTQRWAVIAASSPDVVLLQEVRARDIEALLDVAGSEWSGYCSTSLPPAVGPSKRGVGVLVRSDFPSCRPRRLPDDACFPGDLQEGPPFKALMVDVAVPKGFPITFISAHARPAGRFFRNLKPSFATALAKWVRDCPNLVVMGIDANAPDVDHPDLTKIKFGWDSAALWPRHEFDPGAQDPHSEDAWGEDRLLGPKAHHLLKDAYREYHDREGLAPVTPEGPLAISYEKLGKRYDHLLVSPRIRVSSFGYDNKAGKAGGSDHAVLRAVLSI